MIKNTADIPILFIMYDLSIILYVFVLIYQLLFEEPSSTEGGGERALF